MRKQSWKLFACIESKTMFQMECFNEGFSHSNYKSLIVKHNYKKAMIGGIYGKEACDLPQKKF